VTLEGFDPEPAGQLDALLERVGPRFTRAEPRRRAELYVRGLLSDMPRKNSWTLAEFAGEPDATGMQRLLSEAGWDADGVRDDVRGWIVEQLDDWARGVLVVDEIRFPKRGTTMAGAYRQYDPVTFRTGNAQLALFMAYVSARGRALVDRELYLPEEWIVDRDRARHAGVPEGVPVASKPDLAIRMIERAVEAHGKVGWVVADGPIGESARLRRWLEERALAYVLPARGDEPVVTRNGSAGGPGALSDLIPRSAWTRLSGSPPVQTPERWARIMVGDVELDEGGDRWESSLLINRSADRPARVRLYRCYAPAGTPLSALIRVARSTGAVRDLVQAANENVGLNQYQVRRYEPWYRHVTLCLLAAAYLAVSGQPEGHSGSDGP
jgi:SRSO17 transposase